MDLKINSFIVFVFLSALTGFAQDPAKSTKTIYKIPAEQLKTSSLAKEPSAQPREEKKAIHSCEVKKKEAVITVKNPDGTLSTETTPVKENK